MIRLNDLKISYRIGGRTIDAWTELDQLLRRQVRGRILASADA